MITLYIPMQRCVQHLSCVIHMMLLLTAAHKNMKAGSILRNAGSLTNSSVNRSPYAYEQNPDKNK